MTENDAGTVPQLEVSLLACGFVARFRMLVGTR